MPNNLFNSFIKPAVNCGPLSDIMLSGSPCNRHTLSVMNRLDPIEELYNMYLEEEDTLRIIEIEDDGLDLVSDVEGLADPYIDL